VARVTREVIDVELDVEKRLQADVLKNRVRVKEFFMDFDRLRKGFVGEAAVSPLNSSLSSVPPLEPSTLNSQKMRCNSCSESTN
jgi:hypothetical protein